MSVAQVLFSIPSYVPEVKGFWMANGEWSDCDQRLRWIKDNILCDGVKRLFACWCARSVLDKFESQYPNDTRPRNAIEVAERFALHESSVMEMDAAAANDAANAAYAAAYAAYAAAYAYAAAAAYAANTDAVRLNQSLALSLFATTSFTVSETTIGLCRSWYETRDTFVIGLIADSLQDSGFPYDYRIEMMEKHAECMAIGMWPLTPEIILDADSPH